MDNKGRNKRILVVEDEAAIREICRRVLVREGYSVDIAENGQQAQEKIHQNEYDMFLVDMKTPIIDGQELYVWLLQEKPGMANRVLFTTGDLIGGEILRFISTSRRPFLPKPFTGEELRLAVHKTLASLSDPD